MGPLVMGLELPLPVPRIFVCMCVWMYGWMDVCVYVWMYGCMDGWMYKTVRGGEERGGEET